jgi:deoxycytidylate deaminase
MHQRDMLFCVDAVRRLSRNSRALRAKVGCLIWDMKRRTIISLGYNGTPEGEDNQMELNNVTLDTVVHAEMNALRKLRFWELRKHLVLFVTHAPCKRCAEMIVKYRIRKVYYLDNYGAPSGLEHLRAHHVDVRRLLSV